MSSPSISCTSDAFASLDFPKLAPVFCLVFNEQKSDDGEVIGEECNMVSISHVQNFVCLLSVMFLASWVGSKFQKG